MKKRNKKIIILIFTVLLIPLFFVLAQNDTDSVYREPAVKLYLSREDKVISLLMEDYITGTVAAEMPASFDLEALKAQAVCARTYAYRKLLEEKPYPQDADLSDDINSCQAYISENEFYQRHPQANSLFRKIKEAVSATRGEIMVYQSEPIDALYHSTCGGSTENSADVWGNGLPYLRSVKCQYCEDSNYYNSVQVFSFQDLKEQLSISGQSPDIRVTESTVGGRIKTVVIDRTEISGEKLRQLLQLPSTWCSFKVEDEQIKIHSRGYGHGLGLCQYGAQGMADAGKNYREMLTNYYQGVEFETLKY